MPLNTADGYGRGRTSSRSTSSAPHRAPRRRFAPQRPPPPPPVASQPAAPVPDLAANVGPRLPPRNTNPSRIHSPKTSCSWARHRPALEVYHAVRTEQRRRVRTPRARTPPRLPRQPAVLLSCRPPPTQHRSRRQPSADVERVTSKLNEDLASAGLAHPRGNGDAQALKGDEQPFS